MTTVDERRAQIAKLEVEIMAQLLELGIRRGQLDRLRGPFAWLVRWRADRSLRRLKLELNGLLIAARSHLGDLDRLHGRPT